MTGAHQPQIPYSPTFGGMTHKPHPLIIPQDQATAQLRERRPERRELIRTRMTEGEVRE